MRSTVVGLRPDDTVGFHNSAWDRFAEENGAPQGVGWAEDRPVVEAFPPVLRPFYRDLFAEVREEGVPLEHDYECSSPALFRRFRLRVVPLSGGGLLLVHHLAEQRPHDRVGLAPSDHLYRNEHGLITQCAHCRMVRRAREPDTWDWVPEWVAANAEDVSHGLCPVCFRHYYPELAAKRDAQRAAVSPRREPARR